jgi:hypothetical protein
LKALEERVRVGQGRKVETWGHRGASAAFREFVRHSSYHCTELTCAAQRKTPSLPLRKLAKTAQTESRPTST